MLFRPIFSNKLLSSRMKKPLAVGILGCSSFAMRAMGPAVAKCAGLQLKAMASRDPEKAKASAAKLGCQPVASYEALLEDPYIDVIYMPLPTALHLEWGLTALRAGKHLLVEKSLASNACDAKALVDEAAAGGRVLLENFLFLRHSQLRWIKDQLADGVIGRLRFLRAAFTIPPLDDGNFRYDRSLGGGALLDTGAYMTKVVDTFLGSDASLVGASIHESVRRGVDTGGAAMYAGKDGESAQVEWAFDCHYQCTWDLMGESGRITCTRALTPPPGFKPPVRLEFGGKVQELELADDDHYAKQWTYFRRLVDDPQERQSEYERTINQAERASEILSRAIRKTIP